MKITFTGHRPNKLNNEYDLRGPCTEYIKNELELILKHLKVKEANVGMAIGFDTLAALVCLDLGIKVHCWVPCKNQEKMWGPKSQALYHKILSLAKSVHYVSNAPFNNHCMQDRNEAMIDDLNPNEDKIISCYDGTSGGTNNCLKYAKTKGFIEKRNIFNINPKLAINY